MCPSIEEYSRLLGVHYDIDSIATPPLSVGFKSRLSITIGIKGSVIEQKGSTNECKLKFLSDLFTNRDAFERNNCAFWVTHEEWEQHRVLAIELVILGHVLLPKNLTGVDIRRLQF